MASSYPHMQQRYRDDDEDGSAGVHAPLLSTASLPAQPRWAHEVKQLEEPRRRRKFTLTMGAVALTYLLYCGWVAYSRYETSAHSRGASSEADIFPHPFPRIPHHPAGPPPAISVLGCASIPNPTEDIVSEKIKLTVSYPSNATVVLHHKLLFGDVIVEKNTDEKEELVERTEESTLNVAIKVAARPPFPDHFVSEEEDEETFVLCATTLVPHSTPGHEHPHSRIEGSHPPAPPHPHGRVHTPPVIVDIFPALNETYPKLPPSPFPHHGRGRRHHKHLDAKFSNIWHATISFLFPMFTELPSNHGDRPCHGAPHPPPPPFIVTQLSATVSKTSHVVYGGPPPPPHPFFWHPHPCPIDQSISLTL